MRRWISTAAVFALAFLYFSTFRRLGFQVEDEGTLLFQLHRAFLGERPGLDFHTGYGPGYFLTAAPLLASGIDAIASVRTATAVVNSLSAAALFHVARVLGAGPLALAAPVLWIGFLPNFEGTFASFNIPYPMWISTLAWMAGAVCLLVWSRGGRTAALAGAGLAAAFAFSVKLNAGAFLVAGGTWAVVLCSRCVSRTDRAVSAFASVAMGAGVGVAFAGAPASAAILLVLTPAAAAALVAMAAPGAAARAGSPRVSPSLVIFAASFLVPTVAWCVPTALQLGAARFLEDVLFLGSDAAEVYYSAAPAPEPYAIGVVLLFVAAAVGSRWWPRLPAAMRGVTVATAVGGVGTILFAARGALMPEGPLASVVSQLENSAFWFSPIANAFALALVWRRRAEDAAFAVVAPLAAAMYLQLYPRFDFMHLVSALPLTACASVALLRRLAAPATIGNSFRARASLATLASLVLLAGSLPTAAPLATASKLVRSADTAALARLPLLVDPGAGDDLVALEKAARLIADRTETGEAVLAFPALGGILLAAERASAVPHDYWWAGRPDTGEEAEMLGALRAMPPRYVVTLNSDWRFFEDSPGYFSAMREFVRSRYSLVARFGRYDVLARNDLSDLAIPVERWQPTGSKADAALPGSIGARLQAVTRWLAALTPEDVAAGSLPASTREAVLLLRSVGMAADMRAACLVVAGLGSDHGRIHREADSAVARLLVGYEAARSRWANDLQPADFAEFVRPCREQAARFAGDPVAGELARVMAGIAASGEGQKKGRAAKDRGPS